MRKKNCFENLKLFSYVIEKKVRKVNYISTCKKDKGKLSLNCPWTKDKVKR